MYIVDMFEGALFKSADHLNVMPSADDFKAKGNEAFAEKKFLKAAKLYRDAIALDSSNPVLFSNRSQCFINLADWSRAYRDAEAGLLLNPNDKIKGKLLFRKGLSAKELGFTDVASLSFEEVVQLDPSNRSAQEELRLISGSVKSKKPKSSKEFQIPLEVVQTLPRPFDSIVHSTQIDNDVHSSKIVSDDGQQLGSQVNLAIEELFGSQNTQEESSKKTDNLKFNELPSMYQLKSLANVPKEQKLGAYKIVTDLDESTLKEMFSNTGVDSEFFDFYVESAIFALSSGAKSPPQILSTLQLFRSLPRFSLVASMCPQSQISTLLVEIEKKLPQLASSFRDVLL